MPDVLFMEGEMQYFKLELEQEKDYHWLTVNLPNYFGFCKNQRQIFTQK